MTLEAQCTTTSDVLVYDTAAAAACAGSAGAESSLFGNAAPAEAPAASQANGESSVQQVRGNRRGRQRTTKNDSDAENQRLMNHMAFERNRRRQMSEALAALRSFLPDSYVHQVRNPSLLFVPEPRSLRCGQLAMHFQFHPPLVSMGFRFSSVCR